MNFLQHYSDGWNVEAIVLLGILWFGLVPVVACVVAARVFEERERGDVTGRSVFYGLITGICLSVLAAIVTIMLGGLWAAVAAPPVAAIIGVLSILAYYKVR